MAEQDIMPYTSSHGGHATVRVGYAEDAAVFLKGEAVDINANGVMNETTTDPDIRATPPGAVGIAAIGAQAIADSFTNTGSTSDIDNLDVQYYPFTENNMFFTRNMFNNSDTTIAFSITNVADGVNLYRTSGGVWGVDIGGSNKDFNVLRLLDDDGQNAVVAGTTVTGCVFAVSTST